MTKNTKKVNFLCTEQERKQGWQVLNRPSGPIQNLQLGERKHTSWFFRASFNFSLPAGNDKSAWISCEISSEITLCFLVFSVDGCLFTYFFLIQAPKWHFRKFRINISIRSKDIYFQSGILSQISCEIWKFLAGYTRRGKDSLLLSVF